MPQAEGRSSDSAGGTRWVTPPGAVTATPRPAAARRPMAGRANRHLCRKTWYLALTGWGRIHIIRTP